MVINLKKSGGVERERVDGQDSGIIEVPEEYIISAKDILNMASIRTGYSGAAGLAGKLFTGIDGLAVNTGVGVEELLT